MATEKRLIEYDKVYEYAFDGVNCGNLENEDFDAIINAIDSVPTVDAVEVVHGRWDTTACEQAGTLTAFTHHCPNCNYLYKDLHYKGHNYCPNCGAKMDGEAINEA